MTWMKGQKPRNRKLPPDEILLGHIRAGMKPRAIADLYGVTDQAVRELVKARDWNRPAPAAPTAAPASRALVDTPSKIVTRREGLPHFRSRIVVEFAISLPRVPTLHGQFQGA